MLILAIIYFRLWHFLINAYSDHRSHNSFMLYIKVSGEQFADKLE
jgi:hypothetical protein